MWVTTKRKYKKRKPNILPITVKAEPKEKKIDLSESFWAIKGQGNTNSCAAFAVVSVVQYIMNKGEILENKDELSERFLYRESIKYDTISKHGYFSNGIYLTSALHIASSIGICTEKMFPFYQNEEELIKGEINENIDPSISAFEDAAKYKVSIYGYIKELNSSLYNKKDKILSIKKVLSLDLPVIICYKNSFGWIDSWYSFYTGYIMDPGYGSSGRHCVVIVGYDDDLQIFKFRNSWDGKLFYWGDKGYGYIKYEDINIITQGWIVAGIKIKETEEDQIQIARSQFKI